MYAANEGTEAARQNAHVIGWVNDKTGIGVDVILTDATLVYNIREGERVMIGGMVYGLSTISDSIHIELGYTDAANGAGSFTPISCHRHVTTGAALAPFSTQQEPFAIARSVAYSEGARSITFRATANDVDAAITIEWVGWIEKEN
jgi:hypothetical protein